MSGVNAKPIRIQDVAGLQAALAALGLPPFDDSNEGQVLKIVDGVLTWSADLVGGGGGGGGGGGSIPPTGGLWDALTAGGGRMQTGAWSSDGLVFVGGGDQGGKARWDDFSDIAKAYCVNGHVTDPNNDRTQTTIWAHPSDASKLYAMTHAGPERSTDKGVTWVKDTVSGRGVLTQTQPGQTASVAPRVTDSKGCINAINDEIWPDDTGIKRFVAATQTWDNCGFTAGGKCLGIAQNPTAHNEVYAIFAYYTGSTYSTKLYRCTNTSVATPTWIGPFTGGTVFTTPGATFYPQRIRFCGNGIIVACLNPLAVNANGTLEAIEHGLYVLDARTSTLSAAFHKLGSTTSSPVRTATGDRCISNIDLVDYGDGTVGVGVSFTNVNNTVAYARGIFTGQPTNANQGTWAATPAGMPNLFNGVAGKPWYFNPPGTVAAPLGTIGAMSIHLHPTNKAVMMLLGHQGAYRSADFDQGASSHYYPVSFGVGGVTAFPGAAIAPNGAIGMGQSDYMFSIQPPITGGAVDPGKALPVSRPSGVGNQIHGSLVAVLSDGRWIVGSRDYADATKYKVWIHPALDLTDPANPVWNDSDWSDEGMPNGSSSDFPSSLIAIKNGSGQRRIVVGKTGNGWYGATNGGAFAHPTTPPATPSTYADGAAVGDADAHMAAYVDTTGISISSDSGANWSTILGSTIGSITSALRNFCGFCDFVPGDPTRLIAASDSHVWLIRDPFTSPIPYDITGAVTRPGPITVTSTAIYVHQRNTDTVKAQCMVAAIPSTYPPATPAWAPMPDPNGRYGSQMSLCCKLTSLPDDSRLVASSQGGGSIVFLAEAA